jgi:ribosomal protein S20
MKTKFEQDLVSAISEKDKAQTELKEAQKKAYTIFNRHIIAQFMS